MLNKIELYNFKCFQRAELTLTQLNVFSGLNGMGKSSIIQSMLLLKQSEQQKFLPQKVCLNGEYVNLGVSQDILHENSNEEYIKVILSENSNAASFEMQFNNDNDVLSVKSDEYSNLDFFKNSFEYLNADRRSPQVIYPKSSVYIDNKSQLGINGEYSIHYLAKHEDNISPWISFGEEPVSIKGAVQFWLNEISPNVKIDVQEITNTDYTKLGFYYMDNIRSRTFRPTNVGFGISYILPVIISLVKATQNSILIIENPEAHLHPKGQRKIGELIAKCASNGVQVFIETHSDHVLNGIRIATKHGNIKNDNVNLFYFSKGETGNHIIETPKLNSDGRLNYWPDGFFDEWEKALDEII